MVGVKADPLTTLTVSAAHASHTFSFGADFVAFTGAQTADVNLDAELVFVGYGIESPAENWHDYKGQAQDYRGKILVMLVNEPPPTAAEPNLFGGPALTYNGRWTYKFEQAARLGAAGALLVHTDASAGYPWSVVRTSNGSWRFDLERTANDSTPFLLARAWLAESAAQKLVGLSGQTLDALRRQAASRDFKPVALGVRGTMHLKSAVRKVAAPNVVGILEGRDAALKNEYVAVTAHWDHFGIGEPDSGGDTIYNGAFDNASGVSGVLETAAYFAALPPDARPKRSLLFVFPTGEEARPAGRQSGMSNIRSSPCKTRLLI